MNHVLSQITTYRSHFYYDTNLEVWILDEAYVSPETQTSPYKPVTYTPTVFRFISDVIAAAEAYFKLHILDIDYQELYKAIDTDVPVSSLNTEEILISLLFIVRRERFSEGFVYAKIADGSILNLVNQLHAHLFSAA